MRGKTNSVTTSGGSSENTLKKLLDARMNTYSLFNGYKGTSVDELIRFDDTENVTSTYRMFSGAPNLLTVPLLNTINVTNMGNMFSGNKITTVPHYNTSKVTNMSQMFSNCDNLTTIPQFDTSNVDNMNNMFSGCSSLTSVPLLNTSKVTNMGGMFSDCTSLTEIPAFDVSNATTLGDYIFNNCRKLIAIHMVGAKVSFNIYVHTNFTTEALHEIIDNLATVTSTQTLKMGSINLAKVSEEYKAIATNKGWTLA